MVTFCLTVTVVSCVIAGLLSIRAYIYFGEITDELIINELTKGEKE